MQSHTIRVMQALSLEASVESCSASETPTATLPTHSQAISTSQPSRSRNERHQLFLYNGGFHISTDRSINHNPINRPVTPEQCKLQRRLLNKRASYNSNDYFSARFHPNGFWAEKRLHHLVNLKNAEPHNPAIYKKLYDLYGEALHGFLFMFPLLDKEQQSFAIEFACLQFKDSSVKNTEKMHSLLLLIDAHMVLLKKSLEPPSLAPKPRTPSLTSLSESIGLTKSILFKKSSLLNIANYFSTCAINDGRHKLLKFFHCALHSTDLDNDAKEDFLVALLLIVNTGGLSAREHIAFRALFLTQSDLLGQLLDQMSFTLGCDKAKVFIFEVMHEYLKKNVVSLSQTTKLLSYIQPILALSEPARAERSINGHRRQLCDEARSIIHHQINSIAPLQVNLMYLGERADYLLGLLINASYLGVSKETEYKLHSLLFCEENLRLLFDRLASLDDVEDKRLILLQITASYLDRNGIQTNEKLKVLSHLIEERINSIPAQCQLPTIESAASKYMDEIITNHLSILDVDTLCLMESYGLILSTNSTNTNPTMSSFG
jgi:hypothetical protein